MNITEWFDVNNKDHLRAYQYLTKTGVWPEGFLSDVFEFPNAWQITIMAKMAKAYLKNML